MEEAVAVDLATNPRVLHNRRMELVEVVVDEWKEAHHGRNNKPMRVGQWARLSATVALIAVDGAR